MPLKPLRAACVIAALVPSTLCAAQTLIGGHIVDGSNQPLAGATVQAVHFDQLYHNVVLDGQAVSDARGDFAITALATSGDASGRYAVIASAPTRVPIMYPRTVCFAGTQCPGTRPANVSVPNAAVDFQLLVGASISGRITRSDSHAGVARVEVDANLNGETFGVAETDGDGNYRIDELLPGTYALGASPTLTADRFQLLPQVYAAHDYDSITAMPAGDAVVVASEGLSVAGKDFVLHVGGVITGRVTSTIDGQPISASISFERVDPAPVSPYQLAGQSAGFLSASANPLSPGIYTIRPLMPGSYHVEFGNGTLFAPLFYANASTDAAATAVVVGAGETVGGIDAQLTPRQTLGGHVTDGFTGRPVVGAIVHGGWQFGSFLLLDAVDAQTDASGDYLLQGIGVTSMYVWATEQPTYFATFYPSVAEIGCCALAPAGASAVDLSAGQSVSGIDITMSRGAYATGRVYDPDTGDGGVGVPISLVAPDLTTYGNAYADASGGYTSLTVPTGSYYLMAFLRDGSTVYYPNYVCSTQCDLNQARLFTFDAAQGYPIDFPIRHLDRVFVGGFEP